MSGMKFTLHIRNSGDEKMQVSLDLVILKLYERLEL